MESVVSKQRSSRRCRAGRIVVGMLVMAALVGPAGAQDLPGSHDHPFISRMPFATIVAYSQEESGAYPLVLGALPSDDATVADAKRASTLQGRVTRIQYRIESGLTASDVYHQYGYSIRRGALETLVERKGPPTRAPGGRVWLRTVFASLGKDAVDGLATSTVPQQRRFYAGRQAREGGDVYLVLVVNQHTDKEVRVQVDIIEL